MNIFSSSILFGNSLASLSFETIPVKEVKMIALSSWEWFLLLLIVVLITWLLILFQVHSVRGENDQSQSHAGHE